MCTHIRILHASISLERNFGTCTIIFNHKTKDDRKQSRKQVNETKDDQKQNIKNKLIKQKNIANKVGSK